MATTIPLSFSPSTTSTSTTRSRKSRSRATTSGCVHGCSVLAKDRVEPSSDPIGPLTLPDQPLVRVCRKRIRRRCCNATPRSAASRGSVSWRARRTTSFLAAHNSTFTAGHANRRSATHTAPTNRSKHPMAAPYRHPILRSTSSGEARLACTKAIPAPTVPRPYLPCHPHASTAHSTAAPNIAATTTMARTAARRESRTWCARCSRTSDAASPILPHCPLWTADQVRHGTLTRGRAGRSRERRTARVRSSASPASAAGSDR